MWPDILNIHVSQWGLPMWIEKLTIYIKALQTAGPNCQNRHFTNFEHLCTPPALRKMTKIKNQRDRLVYSDIFCRFLKKNRKVRSVRKVWCFFHGTNARPGRFSCTNLFGPQKINTSWPPPNPSLVSLQSRMFKLSSALNRDSLRASVVELQEAKVQSWLISRNPPDSMI